MTCSDRRSVSGERYRGKSKVREGMVEASMSKRMLLSLSKVRAVSFITQVKNQTACLMHPQHLKVFCQSRPRGQSCSSSVEWLRVPRIELPLQRQRKWEREHYSESRSWFVQVTGSGCVKSTCWCAKGALELGGRK